ncbi:MAG: FkbM family methyltransferase [Crocinitomicaceae bacterium]|nr:FkbM family methyltransferase [Crocinitomicaceae bacterium]
MRNIYLYDIPEKNTFQHIRKKLKKRSPVIFDCGANIGLYSLNLAKLYPNAQIHSFEPLTYNFEIFKNNITLNSFNSIVANQLGVGSKNEELDIKFGAKKSGASLYENDFNNEGSETIKITTIDNYCTQNNISEIDLIKIDIEGAEMEALRGAETTLKKSKSCIIVAEVIEQHLKAAKSSTKEVFEFLENLGFKAFLPKSWPQGLKEVNHKEFPEDYLDNVFFIKG